MAILAHLIQSASSLPTDASALESAISALERDIRTLENSSVPWERALPWLTAVVALGVAMELWVAWRDRSDDMHLWRRGVICWPPDRPSIVKFVVEIVSVLLITGGIVGELWAGVRITDINGSLRSKGAELRNKSDQLVALLNSEAGSARREAGEANERTSKNERETAGLKLEAARLSERAEQLKQDNLKLESELSPRLFTEQQDAINRLSKFTGTKAVLEYVSDVECRRTAEQVAFVLEGAKWKYEPKPNPDPDIFLKDRIMVIGDGNDAKALAEELNRTEFDAELTQAPLTKAPMYKVPEGFSVLIRVGMKPSPREKRETKPIDDAISAFEKSVDEALASGKAPPLPPDLKKFLKPGTHINGSRVHLPLTPLQARLEKTEQTQQVLERRVNPRWRNLIIDANKFSDSLKDKPTAPFEILYVKDDEDGFTFAGQLSVLLKKAGWEFKGMRPLRDEDALPGYELNTPLPITAGAWYGIGLTTNPLPEQVDTMLQKNAVGALLNALGGGGIVSRDDRLPHGMVRIILGHSQAL